MTWVNGRVVLKHCNIDTVNNLVKQLKTSNKFHTTELDVTGWKQQGSTLTVKWSAAEVSPGVFSNLERSGFTVSASWWDQSTKTEGEFVSTTALSA